jgi:hypothetical protein
MTEAKTKADKAQEILNTLDKLKQAVDLTHAWRGRVHRMRGYAPPTAYHRVMLYLWARWYFDSVDTIAIFDISENCGFRQSSLMNMLRRMENDGLVNLASDPDAPFRKTVCLTPLGREVIEL